VIIACLPVEGLRAVNFTSPNCSKDKVTTYPVAYNPTRIAFSNLK